MPVVPSALCVALGSPYRSLASANKSSVPRNPTRQQDTLTIPRTPPTHDSAHLLESSKGLVRMSSKPVLPKSLKRRLDVGRFQHHRLFLSTGTCHNTSRSPTSRVLHSGQFQQMARSVTIGAIKKVEIQRKRPLQHELGCRLRQANELTLTLPAKN